MSTITLNQAINTVMQLPFEQQEMLIDVIQNRHIEDRRQEISADAKKSIAQFRAGELKAQPVKNVISELRQSLIEKIEE
jgi:ATP phosphoribosyltransferase regulatory subunit HisZ